MRLTNWLLFFAIVACQNIFAISSKDVPSVPAVIAQDEFDNNGEHYVLQLVPSGKTTVRPGELSCGSGEVKEGDFELYSEGAVIVLRSDSKELTRINVQYIDVERKKLDSNWHVHGKSPLFLLHRNDKLPLVVLVRYGACIWLEFSVYWLEHNKGEFTIKPVKFSNPTGNECVGEESNVLYAENIKMSFDRARRNDVLWIKGYDNSLEGFFTTQFIEQWDTGTWRCVSHHSDMTQDEILEDD